MKLKRKIYIGLTMLLGVELMIILHVLLETWYISLLTTPNLLVPRYNFWLFSTYLPPLAFCPVIGWRTCRRILSWKMVVADCLC